MVGKKRFDGIITPLVTPYANGRINAKDLGTLLEFVRKIGVNGVFPAGSTGCFPFLTANEHIELIKTVADSMDNKIALFPGVGRNSITETFEVARAASRLDPYAIVLVTPYYIHLNDSSLFAYFDKVASAVEGDIILYNIPQFTGEAISVPVARRLAEKHKNIIGIKDSSGDFRSFVNFLGEMPDNFMVFQGQDDLLLPSLMLGAAGGVCGTTNFTRLAVDVFNAHKKGDTKHARALQERLTKVMNAVNSVQFPEGYHLMFYKQALGRFSTNAVPPIVGLSATEAKELYERVKRLL
jgi:4-hydroxy-tetrahydrodipicolinate synthase/2-dehydro-3-deoxy-D-gluconate aldolase